MKPITKAVETEEMYTIFANISILFNEKSWRARLMVCSTVTNSLDLNKNVIVGMTVGMLQLLKVQFLSRWCHIIKEHD
jgi:hypothetical protein